jgi:cytochrome c oxidase assembly factor CtaG
VIKQLRLSRLWLGALALVLVGLMGTLGFAQTARAAGDYSMKLRAPAEVRQFENVDLTAIVTDSQGQPVNGVPVTFQLPPDWQKNARVVPNQVMTSNGTANAAFDANMPGVVMVTAQAGNTSQTARITVTAQGSRVYDKQP